MDAGSATTGSSETSLKNNFVISYVKGFFEFSFFKITYDFLIL